MMHLLISDQSLILKAKINEYTKAVLDERNDFNYCTFDFETSSLEDIMECLESPAFGSDKKIVICKNPYFFKDSKMKLPFTNDLKLLENYLAKPNDDCEFIIVCSRNYFNNKNKTYQMVAKACKVENLLLDNEYEFKKYALSLKDKVQLDITDEAMDMFVFRCDLDVCKLEREIAKLSLYGQKIDVDVVNKMVAKPLTMDVFELSSALLIKDYKNIMRIYNDLKLLKMEPITLIALLASQFRLLLQVSLLKKQNKLDSEVATILSVHPYRVKLAKEYCQNFPLSQIKDILCQLATLDYDIKAGKKDRFIDFELFLATQ